MAPAHASIRRNTQTILLVPDSNPSYPKRLRHVYVDSKHAAAISLTVLLSIVALTFLIWCFCKLSPRLVRLVRLVPRRLRTLGRRVVKARPGRGREHELDRLERCEDADPTRDSFTECVPAYEEVESRPPLTIPPPAYGSWVPRRQLTHPGTYGAQMPRQMPPPSASSRLDAYSRRSMGGRSSTDCLGGDGALDHAGARREQQREQRLARWRREMEQATRQNLMLHNSAYRFFRY